MNGNTKTTHTAVSFLGQKQIMLLSDFYDQLLNSVGNPCDQMTRYMEFVTIFSSAYGRVF